MLYVLSNNVGKVAEFWTLCNATCQTLSNIAYMSGWEGIGTIAPPYTLIQTRGPFYNLFIVVFTNYLQLLEI